MSKPLTEEQIHIVRGCAWDTDEAGTVDLALARLDFLERKVQAADCLVRTISVGELVTIDLALAAYDEVK